MVKRKQSGKTPTRLKVAHTPSVNLIDEIKASTELLVSQRRKENSELEYALLTTVESAEIKDINDEFTREYLFVEQAKVAATAAIKRMQELNIPTEVPSTYKGEMIKDEKQMAKVRDNLKSKKDAIEKSEKMKKLRELKKMGKKIQEEVLKKRNKEKKDFLEKVKSKPVAELFDD